LSLIVAYYFVDLFCYVFWVLRDFLCLFGRCIFVWVCLFYFVFWFWTRPVGRVRFRWFLWFICCVIFVVYVGRDLDMGRILVSMSSLSIIRKCRENVWILRGFGRSL
jgi:hypothetical protein